MQPDVLEQLRDIHLPAPPTWWPPAPGWWLLAGIVLASLGLLTHYILQRRRRRLPLRQAQKLLGELYQSYQRGELGATGFVNASNELLKRLLVHSLHRPEARPASGPAWLKLLDSYAVSDEFTHGPGQALGDARFQPAPSIDVPALHDLLAGFLQRVTP